eukprot:s1343_g15.t1
MIICLRLFYGNILATFLPIFQRCRPKIAEEEKYAYMLSTASVFAGMLLMRLLIAVTHFLDPDHERELEKIETITSEGSSVPSSAPLSDGQVAVQGGEKNPRSDDQKRKEKKLWRMGISTALAMTIHNVPEGLAGMVAGLNDPSVGFTLTLAIAIHNIPEGLCIALPIYYSKGSRFYGFLLATLSGLAEPVGALIAWGIVAASSEDMYGTIYGVLFGLVAGIMIILVLMELLPTAHRYDPNDSVVTPSFWPAKLTRRFHRESMEEVTSLGTLRSMGEA